MTGATQFGLSENFPTNLTRLLAALMMGKLALCEKLEGIAETRIVGNLILHLDSTDFRLPVQQMPLSRLARMSQISKSTLCEKLKNLRMMGVLKFSERERQIAFTDEAISLFRGNSEKTENSENYNKTQKTDIFGKFGKFWLPRQAAVFLMGRGLKEEAVAGLMSACKEAGQKLQQVVVDFKDLLSKYDGDILGRVARAVIKDPDRFRTRTVRQQPAKLSQAQRLALQRLADSQPELLLPGEKLVVDGNTLSWSRPAVRGGAPLPITQPMLDTLNGRAERACARALAADQLAGLPGLQVTLSGKAYYWDGQHDQGTVAVRGNDGTRLGLDWLTLYLALPTEHQALASEDSARDPRIGRWFERARVRYQVDDIDGDCVRLYALQKNGTSSVCRITLAQLGEAQITWLEEGGL